MITLGKASILQLWRQVHTVEAVTPARPAEPLGAGPSQAASAGVRSLSPPTPRLWSKLSSQVSLCLTTPSRPGPVGH